MVQKTWHHNLCLVIKTLSPYGFLFMVLDMSSSQVLYMLLKKATKGAERKYWKDWNLKTWVIWAQWSHLIPYKESIVTMEKWLTLRVPGGHGPTPLRLYFYFSSLFWNISIFFSFFLGCQDSQKSIWLTGIRISQWAI